MKTRKLLSLLMVLAMVMACAPAFAATIEPQPNARIVPEGEEFTLTIFQSLTSTVEDLSYEKN